jgi:hypothetical protein
MFIASFAVGSLPLMFKSSTQGMCELVWAWGLSLTGRISDKSCVHTRNGITRGGSFDDHYSRVSLQSSEELKLIIRGVSTVYGALPETDAEHHDESTTRAIGLALLAGFALMLL